MDNLKQHIQQAAAQALQTLFAKTVALEQVVVQHTAQGHSGHFTIVLFALAKLGLGRPDEVGEKLGQALSQPGSIVASYEVVKGFLNLTIAPQYWLDLLRHISADEQAFLSPNLGQGEKVVVEYSSPNTNKPLHLGHLRNNFLGDSLCRILGSAGYEVVRTQVVNDRGIHICKSMLAWQRFGGRSPEAEGLKGDHLVGKYYVEFERHNKVQTAELVAQGVEPESAKMQTPLMHECQDMLRLWEAGDPDTRQLWAQMNGWVYAGFDATYQRMGVHFDQIYYESSTYLLGKDIVDEGLAKGVFYKRKDGAVAIDLSADGLDEKVLLRADGTSVYMTQDLGLADRKFADHHAPRSVYVVGNEQDYHFKVLFLIMHKLGRPYAAGMHHLSYGMVELPTGKMKSREGTVVDADDLMQAVVQSAAEETAARGKTEGLDGAELDALYETLGLGALKYYLLKVSPQKKMLYDPAESVSLQGDTGPFIQYTHARIHSLLHKAQQMGLAADPAQLPTQLEPAEHDVLRRLSQYPEALAESARSYNPAVLAGYVCELAKDYNRFYHEYPVLRETDGPTLSLRLLLSAATAACIRHSMGLLGIAVPQRM